MKAWRTVGRFVEEPIGDALERFYTPSDVAHCIVRDVLVPILKRHGLDEKPKILEMHVGAGAFVHWTRHYIPGAFIHGNDLDPEAPGLALCDRTSNVDAARNRWSPTWDVVIGNPPWDPDVPAAPTIDHVARAVAAASIVLLVLPFSYAGQPTWHPLMHQRAGFTGVQPLNPRPWGAHREAALYRWDQIATQRKERALFDPLVWR